MGLFEVTATDVIYGLSANAVVNITLTVPVDEERNELPTSYELFQNFPNPFNPTTTINYTIPKTESSNYLNVQLIVYDVLGREVRKLVNEVQKSGEYRYRFNGANLTSGIYFYRITAGDYSHTRKMILLK
jgi:hypothetical protein